MRGKAAKKQTKMKTAEKYPQKAGSFPAVFDPLKIVNGTGVNKIAELII